MQAYAGVMHPILSFPGHGAFRRAWGQFCFFPVFSRFFFRMQKTHEFLHALFPNFDRNFCDFGPSGVDFRPFSVPKPSSGGYFSGVFLETGILSKSSSRCGGSYILKGQDFPKSLRRATPNSDGARNRQKSLPAPSPDALSHPRDRFWSILGSRPAPQMSPKSEKRG